MSLFWRVPEWFHALDPVALERLKSYHADLCKWTKTVNLISQGTIIESDRIHFADAILGCSTFIEDLPQGAAVLDLGSGNGIPGLVLSILRPDLKVCCLDSDERKIGFIKQLGLKLELKNLKVQTARLEAINDNKDNKVFFATARGLASVKKLLLMTESEFASGAVLFHFKGQEWRAELDEVPENLKNKWNTILVKEYSLPLETGSRAILKSTRL